MDQSARVVVFFMFDGQVASTIRASLKRDPEAGASSKISYIIEGKLRCFLIWILRLFAEKYLDHSSYN